jgi:hypothetical protein
MFSHVVIFWTDPNNPQAADDLIAGANKYLKPIPGVLHFHVGKMAPSHRAVVDQSYQVALKPGFFRQENTGRLPGASAPHRICGKRIQAHVQESRRLRLRVKPAG